MLSGIHEIRRINLFQSIEKRSSTSRPTQSHAGCHANTSGLRLTSMVDSSVCICDAAMPYSRSYFSWRNSCGPLRCHLCASLCAVGQRPSVSLHDGCSNARALSSAYGALAVELTLLPDLLPPAFSQTSGRVLRAHGPLDPAKHDAVTHCLLWLYSRLGDRFPGTMSTCCFLYSVRWSKDRVS
jgi:hypothetical protein